MHRANHRCRWQRSLTSSAKKLWPLASTMAEWPPKACGPAPQPLAVGASGAGARRAGRRLRRHRHQPALRDARSASTASTRSPPTPRERPGVLSLFFWSLTMVVVVKYLVFIMRADNQGEGGILALLALVPAAARQARRAPRRCVVLLGALRRGAALRRRHHHAGDLGALGGRRASEVATPAARAVRRAAHAASSCSGSSWSSSAARRGIGALFGPVMLRLVRRRIGGARRCVHHRATRRSSRRSTRGTRCASSSRNGCTASSCSASVVLCITGGEALYADMGHFGRRPDPPRAGSRSSSRRCCSTTSARARCSSQHPATGARTRSSRWCPPALLYPMVVLATVADGHRLAGAHLGRVLADPAGGAARLLPARHHRPHLERARGADLHPRGEQALAGRPASALVLAFQRVDARSPRRTASPSPARWRSRRIVYYFVVTRDAGAGRCGRRCRWSRSFLVVRSAFFGANAAQVRRRAAGSRSRSAPGVFTLMTTWKRGRASSAERFAERTLPLELLPRGPRARTRRTGCAGRRCS